MTQLAPSPKKLAAGRAASAHARRVAASPLPQSRAEVEARLSRIAELRAIIAEREVILQASVAEAERIYTEVVAPLEAEIARLEGEIATWCEARRAELTKNGKTKTVKFVNGEVSWKTGKASVVLTEKEEAIVAALKRLKLKSFIRVSESVDKQMVLKAPERVAKVPGLTVRPAGESFGIVARVPAKERF